MTPRNCSVYGGTPKKTFLAVARDLSRGSKPLPAAPCAPGPQGGREKGSVPFALPLCPSLCPFGDWRAFLSLLVDDDEVDVLRRHQRTGRPLGDDAFVERLEASLGRSLRPRKPGPKPRKGSKEPGDQ